MRDPLSFFGPVIEAPSEGTNSAVISEHPYSIISSGRQNRVPWMTGLNADEGVIKTGGSDDYAMLISPILIIHVFHVSCCFFSHLERQGVC